MTTEERIEKFEREHPELLAKKILELKNVEKNQQRDLEKLSKRKGILKMYFQQNMTLSGIGQLQKPPITKQRVHQIINQKDGQKPM